MRDFAPSETAYLSNGPSRLDSSRMMTESKTKPFLGKRILLLIGGHLATAPRPQKEATVAKKAGFDVEVRGVWWSESLAAEDLELAAEIGINFRPVVDLRTFGYKSLSLRLRQRIARELYCRVGIATARSFGVGAPEMLREALRLRADLTMVHSEAGLWVGGQLLRRGYHVGVDFEDWFSEDMPKADRVGRPVAAIKQLERTLLRKADPTFATTRAMATALAEDAGGVKTPVTIPNAFPSLGDRRPDSSWCDERNRQAVSFYWFSQTIGPNRGLEVLARALPSLKDDWELHLRGNLEAHGDWFLHEFDEATRDRIYLHPSVSNAALPWHTGCHDIGLALEIPHCPSRDLTATNKIFEYLRCGLGVIATSTRGQLEVMAQCPSAGWIVPPEDEEALAKAMQHCINDPDGVRNAKIAAKNASEVVWNWERYSSKMADVLEKCCKGSNPNAR